MCTRESGIYDAATANWSLIILCVNRPCIRWTLTAFDLLVTVLKTSYTVLLDDTVDRREMCNDIFIY